MITRLDGASARKISAGQVITDLTSVVKELLENALDAQAQTVTIRIVGYGLDEITVDDDGTGIPMGPIVNTETGALADGATTPLLCSRASTKHRDEGDVSSSAALGLSSRSSGSFSDLLAQRSDTAGSSDQDGGGRGSEEEAHAGEASADPSLGFRGEALHSLAHMSELTVDTYTTQTAPYTVRVTYHAAAHASQLAALRQRDGCGTTVTVRRLFQHLPVRHREFKKNCRRQLSKAASTVKQYAVSHPHARLLMQHQENSNAAVSTLVSLTGSGDPSRAVTEAYGGLCVSHMQRADWPCSFGEISGFVSKVDGGGRLSSDHQLFALDGRLVDLPRLGKAINDAFTQCLPNASQRLHVSFFLTIKTKASLQYDVNLTPDKRKVLLAQEERLADEVYRCALHDFSLASQSIELNRDQRIAQTRAADLRASELTKLTRTPVSATAFTQFTFKRPKLEEEASAGSAAAGTVAAGAGASGGDGPGLGTSQGMMELPKLGSFLYDSGTDEGEVSDEDPSAAVLLALSSSSSPSSSSSSAEEESDGEGDSGNDGNTNDSSMSKDTGDAEDERSGRASADTAGRGSFSVNSPSQVEVTRLSDEGCCQRSAGACHHCRFPDLCELAKVDLPLPPLTFERTVGEGCTAAHRNSASSTSNARTLGAQTESDLTNYFSKNSFKEMRVIGQFNHGFIIALLNNGDVFIVDQHASDEKYNYERLMREYTARPQPLVIPVAVTMDTHEVDLAIANGAALQQHGFAVKRGADDTKLLVCTLPVLPYDVVSASDVMELVQQLVQYGTITRPLRAVWHSMATKACRSSIMIGTALTMKKMKQILERLGELEQPWNCPHGRPTLRLLGNLAELRRAT